MNFLTLPKYLARNRTEIIPLVEPRVLIPGGFLIIYGKAGSYKSWVALDLAFSVSSGTRWLDYYPTRPGKVMLLQTEMPEQLYLERVDTYYRNWPSDGEGLKNFHLYDSLGINLSDTKTQDDIEKNLDEIQPDLFILDNLVNAMYESDSNEVEVKRIMRKIQYWRHRYQCAFVVVHHPRKKRGGDDDDDAGFDEMRGSGIFNYMVDSILRLTETTGEDLYTYTKLKWEKHRYGRRVKPDAIAVELEEDGILKVRK